MDFHGAVFRDSGCETPHGTPDFGLLWTLGRGYSRCATDRRGSPALYVLVGSHGWQLAISRR